MHEILVILRKDVRRLWWQIAAMLAMCATVGCLDARRAAAQPRIMESLLNVILPLVWACLIAQAIHQEALVGDREFWMTRPYRWPRLLGAKALFVALCVHGPSFVTDAAILAARGYSLIEALPQLLVKQLLLAGGLTLPAMALAALVSNLTQFVIGVPVLFVTFAVAAGFRQTGLFAYMYGTVAHLATAFLGVAAVSIVLLQYRRRRTRLARILAVSTLLAVVLLAPLVAYRHMFALYAIELPAADIHATMTLGPPDPRAVHGPFGRRVFTTLPFKFSGLPESDPAEMASVSMEIAAAGGVRYRYDPPRMDFDTGLTGIRDGSTSLFMGMKPAAYDRIKDSKVTISGTVGFVVYELGREMRLTVGATRYVTGPMHCSSSFEEESYYGPWVNVFCDSPGRYGLSSQIGLDKESLQWLHPVSRRMGAAGSQAPQLAWLSPLHRRQESFRVSVPPDGWLSEAQAGAPIVIIPQRMIGYSTVSFKVSDIDLREYSK